MVADGQTKMARPGSQAREKLLGAAQRLMLAKGFVATTVEEVCETADLTKGSFFYYFASKEELGKAVLDRFVSTMFHVIQTAPFLKKRDPLQRVYGYVDFVIEISKDPKVPSSCLLGTFSQELSDTHPQIRSMCAQHFTEWADALRRDLNEAKAKYAPKTALDTQSLAQHFIAVVEGSLILAKAKQDRGILGKNLQHFKRYLKSLFEKG